MREEDLAEVRAMLEMGEVDIAEDELRWLVGGCEELLEAHHMLGQIALGDGRIDLARAHFGYAYEIGLRALPKDFRGRLPYAVVSNQALLESAKGLGWCLLQLSHREQAAEVINWLLARDPDDPLQAAQLLQEEER